jgi:hypothetical protein
MKNGKIQGYGDVAIQAVGLLKSNSSFEPESAWNKSLTHLKKPRKGCPKNIFILLCSNGLIKGISKSNHDNRIRENRDNLLTILRKLDFENTDFRYYSTVWRDLGINKGHQGEIDILYALYQEDLLHFENIKLYTSV